MKTFLIFIARITGFLHGLFGGKPPEPQRFMYHIFQARGRIKFDFYGTPDEMVIELRRRVPDAIIVFDKPAEDDLRIVAFELAL